MLAGLAVLGASGCRVDERAEIALYRDVLGPKIVIPEEDEDPGAPLGLVGAMNRAIVYSEDLAIEGERFVRAVIDRRRAAAAYLPVVSLSPSYAFRESTGPGRARALEVPLGARFDHSPRSDSAALREAEREAEKLRAELIEAQQALLIDVARTVFEVLRAERERDVLARSVAVQSERVRDARIRSEAGLVRPLDVSLSASALADTRAREIEARSRVESGRALLAFLIGSMVGDRPIIDDLSVAEEPEAVQELLSIARRRRPSLAAAFAEVERAEAAVEKAYGQYWPSVSIDFRLFLSRQTVSAKRPVES